jgi:hypothetical protein
MYMDSTCHHTNDTPGKCLQCLKSDNKLLFISLAYFVKVCVYLKCFQLGHRCLSLSVTTCTKLQFI